MPLTSFSAFQCQVITDAYNVCNVGLQNVLLNGAENASVIAGYQGLNQPLNVFFEYSDERVA
jgi:hypothetical protein